MHHSRPAFRIRHRGHAGLGFVKRDVGVPGRRAQDLVVDLDVIVFEIGF
jgi:hypothetical protein